MHPRQFLRAEGLVALLIALAIYVAFDGPIWLLLVLALAPDLSMVGYLRGPRVGSLLYNAVHTYVAPVALGAAGLWLDVTLAVQVAAIWAGHIGVDRLFGYGLKFPTGFEDTHLTEQPAPVATLSDSDR